MKRIHRRATGIVSLRHPHVMMSTGYTLPAHDSEGCATIPEVLALTNISRCIQAQIAACYIASEKSLQLCYMRYDCLPRKLEAATAPSQTRQTPTYSWQTAGNCMQYDTLQAPDVRCTWQAAENSTHDELRSGKC